MPFSPTADDAPVLDTSVLDDHCSQLGAATVRGIVDKFLETGPQTGARIKEAIGAGDLTGLAAQAHKLGGAALTLGLPRLNGIARAAEHLAKAGDRARALDAGRLIGPTLDMAVAALRDYGSKLDA